MKRKARLYSLFEKQENGEWKQLVSYGVPLDVARRIFQNSLLAFALGHTKNERRLLPIKKKKELSFDERMMQYGE